MRRPRYMRRKCHPQASRGWFPSAFQSICKLSTLMGRQSHPVVTKLRGGIVSFARNSSATLARSNVVSGWAAENKDHSALIAPLRSNRGVTGCRWIAPPPLLSLVFPPLLPFPPCRVYSASHLLLSLLLLLFSSSKDRRT